MTVKKEEPVQVAQPLAQSNLKKGLTYERTVEEIKDRYYQCVFAVVRARHEKALKEDPAAEKPAILDCAEFDILLEQERRWNNFLIL